MIIKEFNSPPIDMLKHLIFWIFKVYNYNKKLALKKAEKLDNFSIFCLDLQTKAM